MAGAYGSIPQLSSSSGISQQIQDILGKVIPGFNNLAGSASDYTKKLLSGVLSPETKNAVQDGAASWGAASGMPGFQPGSIGMNNGLKTLGLTSLGQQKEGFGSFLDLLRGNSGTTAPNFSQAQDQSNTSELYKSAPDPAANIQALLQQFKDAMNPASGRPAPDNGSSIFNRPAQRVF